jgi:hypothetical protein
MAPKKKSTPPPSSQMIFTEDAIVIPLSAAEKRKAKACLAKTGKITFSVTEHSVTKLPAFLENGKLID